MSGRPRSFNYAVARMARRMGWTYVEIAAALGVHHTSVMYACDPYYRARKQQAGRKAAA